MTISIIITIMIGNRNSNRDNNTHNKNIPKIIYTKIPNVWPKAS